ncbi:hypothetical protein [Tessaracoccus flavus]|jgi:hypothetical protein|uniref:Uncharacterized protein n=1 Tax=Tessaracoccus flavus TaxID=1610493 RepID=A0A1Q2CCJ1_9ACTN|nr:hypothetical protein [Tessaracoccus flavus]AQP43843.1 hypothetical protein RPIT_02605 [Tessaracoccus flavus]SDY25910.1 hypothetical protein SAMN05428934_101121 [Tessaracoccus flavus]
MIVIVVFSPRSHADEVRAALAAAGAGTLGNYTACSFSASGEGRFRPEEGAEPYLGEPGRPEVVDEVRIECVCDDALAKGAVEAMLAAHPYEEPAYHCYRALTLGDL